MKYDIIIRETEFYLVEDVESDSEEEALEKAERLLDGDKNKYHHDSDYSVQFV